MTPFERDYIKMRRQGYTPEQIIKAFKAKRQQELEDHIAACDAVVTQILGQAQEIRHPWLNTLSSRIGIEETDALQGVIAKTNALTLDLLGLEKQLEVVKTEVAETAQETASLEKQLQQKREEAKAPLPKRQYMPEEGILPFWKPSYKATK